MSAVKQPVRRPAPTLEEVAAAAGVSRSTVSRVVNGSSQVSDEVAIAVQEAIARLNYIPNRAARSLANRQTMAIALVVPEDASRFFGDPYFSAVVQGIANGLEDSDYVLNLQLTSPSRPSPKTVRYLLGGNVDGAFVVSHHTGDEFLAALGASLPIVFGGRPLDPAETSSYYVDVDNVAAAESGVQRLIDLGHAYAAADGSGDVYFDTASWSAYGELTRQSREDMQDAADALQDLITDEIIDPSKPLTPQQADMILNRAVALNLAGNRVALENMRQRYSDMMKKTDRARLFDVVTRPRKTSLLADRDTVQGLVNEVDLFKDFLEGYRKRDLTQ